MKPPTLLRLALAGTRTDVARVALTAFAVLLATLSLLATATVLAIEGEAVQYTHNLLIESGLRPGVATALALLCIPVLALAGQSARVGAPARDRRLSALRLAGATPRQVFAVAVAETGCAATLGAGLGAAVYFAGRALLHRPDARGRLLLPTDLTPAPTAIALIVVGLPVLAALATALLLRRVVVTPLGVVRRHRTRAPQPWPGLLILVGLGAVLSLESVVQYFSRSGREIPGGLVALLLVGGALLTTAGVVFGTAWISGAAGRVLHRFARRPAALLAARRLQADPWAGSRVFAALLACVIAGAFAAGVRAWFVAMFDAEEAHAQLGNELAGRQVLSPGYDTDFYLSSLDLVDAAVWVATVIAGLGLLVYLVEGITSRRQTHAALVALGVPRRTLAAATGWQMLTPVVPAILAALTVGVAMPRGISREERSGTASVEYCTVDWEQCADPDSPYLRVIDVPAVVRPVALPLAELTIVGGVALAAVGVTIGVSLLFLRASTDLAELRAA